MAFFSQLDLEKYILLGQVFMDLQYHYCSFWDGALLAQVNGYAF